MYRSADNDLQPSFLFTPATSSCPMSLSDCLKIGQSDIDHEIDNSCIIISGRVLRQALWSLRDRCIPFGFQWGDAPNCPCLWDDLRGYVQHLTPQVAARNNAPSWHIFEEHCVTYRPAQQGVPRAAGPGFPIYNTLINWYTEFCYKNRTLRSLERGQGDVW